MSSKNPSTKKSVNRARKANGNGNKSRSATRQGLPDKSDNGARVQNRGVNAPIARSSPQMVNGPRIVPGLDGSRVVNKELIGPIASLGAAFEIVKRLRCNPASSVTFPWLSTIAKSWESYRFRRLAFVLIGRCATTTPGSVILAPDYDAQDGPPSTEQQLGQFKGAVEDVPWSILRLNLSPAAMNRLYKSHVTMDDARFATTTQDEKTIDCAQVFIADDLGAALTMGKLWVEYDVDLTTPQSPQIEGDVGGAKFTLDQTTLTTSGSNLIRTGAAGLLQQSQTQPLLEDLLTTNVSGAVKFLRDWTGDVGLSVNTTTSNAFGGGVPLYKNGISLGTGQTRFQAVNGPIQGGGFFNTLTEYPTTSFNAGDKIQFGSGGGTQGLPFANNPLIPVITLLLGGASY